MLVCKLSCRHASLVLLVVSSPSRATSIHGFSASHAPPMHVPWCLLKDMWIDILHLVLTFVTSQRWAGLQALPTTSAEQCSRVQSKVALQERNLGRSRKGCGGRKHVTLTHFASSDVTTNSPRRFGAIQRNSRSSSGNN
jgi:hypothetical protein